MYMVAERGVNYPLKVTTIQFFEDLSEFVRRCHIDYINHCAELASRQKGPQARWVKDRLETITFAKYLDGWFESRWVIYECKPGEVNQKTGRQKKPENLAECKRKYNSTTREFEYVNGESPFVKLARELGFDLDK